MGLVASMRVHVSEGDSDPKLLLMGFMGYLQKIIQVIKYTLSA